MEPIRSSSSLLTPPPTPTTNMLRIRPVRKRRDNLLLDLPIAGRLTLGFLTAAIIASLITGIIGVVRAQSLGRQSNFYQSLLETNTSLTTGADFLQLLNTEMQQLVANIQGPNPSKETITAEQNAISGLTNRYNTLINQYIASSLLDQHPDQISLLAEGNHTSQVTQQRPLVGSTLRTWHVYQLAQQQILHSIQIGDIATAQNFWHVQGEPTNADAQSALRALILFDQRLASSVRDAATIEEQNQVLSTIIGAVIAFILIAVVGWFISGTLVQRLKQLRQITQVVEQGRLSARVPVTGRDEIADVAASFNAMLETIVGLLDETRQQRDALTNAADHLFSDMRVVSSGDLRVNASVSNDPIGMLANAFNFTVGRFRRFVLRMQGTIEQLDVISRQEFEHAENFAQALNIHNQPTDPTSPIKHGSNPSLPLNALHAIKSDPDITRQSLGFAHEVTLMARQLATLVQEMRTAIISFELDATNTNNSFPLSGGTGIPHRPGMSPIEDKKLPNGIRARSKTSQ